MDEVTEPPAEPAAPEAAVETTAPEATTTDAPAAAEPEGYEALPEHWQKQIRDLRDENAKRRTSYKPFEEAFGGLADTDRDILLDLVATLKTDPTAAGQRMRDIAEALLKGDEPPEPTPEDDRPLTKKELDAIFAEKEQAKAASEAEAKVVQEARDLGYTQGTPDYLMLLFTAREQGGDLKKAHEALEASAQQKIDSYLAKKQEAASGVPAAGSGSGAAPANENPTKDFAQAKASLEARLAAAMGQGS